VTQLLPDGSSRTFPDVGFVLSHLGDSLPVRVRVVVAVLRGSACLAVPSDYYSGVKLWRLNPKFTIFGHFESLDNVQPGKKLRLQVNVSVIDQYEREHAWLPTGFVYVPEQNYWYLEP